jgi:hypothetical protein
LAEAILCFSATCEEVWFVALFVGIDVSKEKFDACGIGEQGKKMFSLSHSINRERFDKLILRLPAVGTVSLLLDMESTASYPIALFCIGSKQIHDLWYLYAVLPIGLGALVVLIVALLGSIIFPATGHTQNTGSRSFRILDPIGNSGT